MWLGLARLIELIFTPLGMLIAWLASLFPRGAPPVGTPIPPRPLPDFAPDPAALAELQDRTAWIGTLIAIALIAALGIAAILVVRLLLANWIGAPLAREQRRAPELTVERSGTPKSDAAAFLVWLMAWLRGRLAGRRVVARPVGGAASDVAAADAWAAYQRLLAWAERQGLGRRPAETTGQLQARLAQHAPAASDAVDLVTETYAWERYGEVHPATDRLRRVRQALSALIDR
jgi:hypothetical protein